jgi:cytochrome P450
MMTAFMNPVADRLPDLAMPFDPPADREYPYHDYAKFRRDSPTMIRHTPGLPPLAWVYRFSDVADVLKDNKRFSNSAARDFLGPTLGEDLLVGLDPPEHPRLRRLIAPAFGPATLAAWKQTVVAQTVTELLDKIEAAGEADLVRDLAFVLPAKVISRVLGLPESDFETFRALAMDIITVAADPVTAHAAAHSLREYLDEIIADRRASPRDDVISSLTTAEAEGERLSHAQIQSFILTLLPAGIETTYRSLGSLLYVLLSNPTLWNRLVADRSLIPHAIEEILRFEAPLQVVFRTARTDLEIAAVHIAAGTHVIPVIGSANRDESANITPDTFELDRVGRKYLTFGTGPHMCLGMHLARLELTAVLEALMQRLPRLVLNEAVVRERNIHIRGLMVRSPAMVPVASR